jgi:hypothetical protein
MRETRFLIFDGVDEVGKSTFIEQVKAHPNAQGKVVELEFPKLLPLSGDLLRINDEKSFELLFAAFKYLDPQYTYILDRFITSNLVYDKVLRGEITKVSMHYWDQFRDLFNVKQILFTRPEINHDFVDDKIMMSKNEFNACIREYHTHGTNHQLVLRDAAGTVSGVDEKVRKLVMDKVLNFIANGW